MSKRKKIFDLINNQLLYVEQEANEGFWDQKWAKTAKNTFSNPPRHRATISITKSYIPVGGRVLEGGCGLGDLVFALDKAGYKAEGIDYAPKVVEAINHNWPHLNVKQGDVRSLAVNSNYYDGYWSVGVIEHFPNGYSEIASEMARVIKVGGYLFLSFPAFNRFRQSRANTGKYSISVKAAGVTDDFFQFALVPEIVEQDFHRLGFRTVDVRGLGALQCLAEDFSWCMAVQSLLECLPSRIGTATSMLIDLVIGRYAGHSCLLIMQKKV